MSTPRLVVVAARAAFAGDALWLDAIARVADAVAHTTFRDVVVQVRLEDQAVATEERATAALAKLRSAAPRVPVLLNAPWLDFTKLGFDGVHWREDAIPDLAPEPAPPRAAASVHSLAAIRRAERAGAQVVLFGPIWSPAWKPATPAGLDALADIALAAHVPVLAIGGVTPPRVADCLAAGAHGVAVASGLLGAPEVDIAFAAYVAALRNPSECG